MRRTNARVWHVSDQGQIRLPLDDRGKGQFSERMLLERHVEPVLPQPAFALGKED